MNLKKNICTTLCSVLAVSTFCVSVYATDTKTEPTDDLINKSVTIERSAVKSEIRASFILFICNILALNLLTYMLIKMVVQANPRVGEDTVA